MDTSELWKLWNESEHAVYHDYFNQTKSVIERLMRHEITEAQYAREIAMLRRHHPRVRLRGTVLMKLP
jgi:hypothetical protein